MEKSKNMGIKNTNRYNLAGFYEKVNPYDFEVTKDLINENGFLKIITKGYSVKVYPPLLAYLFEQVEIVAYNIDKKCNEKIKILEYLNTYIEGFKDGEQYFDKEYKVSPEIIYGGNAEHYVKDLHWQYFHAEHEGYEGWVFVKKSYPFILTHEAIRKWGFYSGIVSSLENVVKKHPKLFEAFDKCEHNLPPQQTEKPKPELTINQIALKYVYLGKQITRENGNEIAKKYGHNSGEKLFQRFTYYSSSANRKGKPNLCTPKKLDNKIKLIESIIELLPTDKQGWAKDEVSILKKIYEAEYQ